MGSVQRLSGASSRRCAGAACAATAPAVGSTWGLAPKCNAERVSGMPSCILVSSRLDLVLHPHVVAGHTNSPRQDAREKGCSVLAPYQAHATSQQYKRMGNAKRLPCKQALHIAGVLTMPVLPTGQLRGRRCQDARRVRRPGVPRWPRRCPIWVRPRVRRRHGVRLTGRRPIWVRHAAAGRGADGRRTRPASTSRWVSALHAPTAASGTIGLRMHRRASANTSRSNAHEF